MPNTYQDNHSAVKMFFVKPVSNSVNEIELTSLSFYDVSINTNAQHPAELLNVKRSRTVYFKSRQITYKGFGLMCINYPNCVEDFLTPDEDVFGVFYKLPNQQGANKLFGGLFYSRKEKKAIFDFDNIGDVANAIKAVIYIIPGKYKLIAPEERAVFYTLFLNMFKTKTGVFFPALESESFMNIGRDIKLFAPELSIPCAYGTDEVSTILDALIEEGTPYIEILPDDYGKIPYKSDVDFNINVIVVNGQDRHMKTVRNCDKAMRYTIKTLREIDRKRRAKMSEDKKGVPTSWG